jgi:hypothetical protein
MYAEKSASILPSNKVSLLLEPNPSQILHISIDIDIYMLPFPRGNGSPDDFLNSFTVYEETNGSHPFASRLNRLKGLSRLAHLW